MIKWQMKFRVEKSNLTCIEKNYPNYTAIGSLLVVVIQEEVQVFSRCR